MILENSVLGYWEILEGTYEIAEIVNGRTSWMEAAFQNGAPGLGAIWFMKDLKVWAIGNKKYIGSNKGLIRSADDQGDKTLFDIPQDEWQYYSKVENLKNSLISSLQ